MYVKNYFKKQPFMKFFLKFLCFIDFLIYGKKYSVNPGEVDPTKCPTQQD